ncbi:MAG: SpoIVB peptidase [Clostridia bacterium]|nr:SpoIVB peptidase [Clostridia bacterium]
MKNLRKIFLIIIITTFIISSQTIVFATNEELFFVGGFPIGFDLSTDGALVVGVSEVICEDDIYTPARDAGIKVGDYILSLNGKKIQTVADIDKVLKEYTNGCLIAEILSNSKKSIVSVYPKKDLSGTYKIGVLIRDYLSGIGTVTIIDQKGNFASLGHPITDEEGKQLGIGGGNIYSCSVVGVIKGSRGTAGELKGNISRINKLGSVIGNSEVGINGNFDNNKVCYGEEKPMPLGEPTLGNATIYTTISGNTPKKYSISIVKIDNNNKHNKDMVIKITDEKLIKYAGGIVQGMSGSPIIQNGKIIGAVTHVFLNDSTRGYAVSIDKMQLSLKINYNS